MNKDFTPHPPYNHNIFLLCSSPISVNNNSNLPAAQVEILEEIRNASLFFKSTSNLYPNSMSFLQEYVWNLTTSYPSTTPSTLVQAYASWPRLSQ